MTQMVTTPTLDTGTSQAVIATRHIAKRFRRQDGSSLSALDNVSLDVRGGEFLVLLGPSGCGKTTLLRSLAGLETPDTGRIELHGRAVFDAAKKINQQTERRGLGMVFQSYALWPHMTATANVAYPIQSRRPRPSRKEIGASVSEYLNLVGIPELAEQRPGQMSGGQQQRVALARALAGGSNIILFDEPLSNVDAKVRQQLRTELLAMQRRLDFAAVYVTHDQLEAMELADRMCVMDRGRVLQVDTPRAVYETPNSFYVANFVGDVNMVPGTVRSTRSGTAVAECELGVLEMANGCDAAAGDPVAVVFRPERCRLVRADTTDTGWPAVVRQTTYLGNANQHRVTVGEREFHVWTPDQHTWEPTDQLRLVVDENALRAVAP